MEEEEEEEEGREGGEGREEDGKAEADEGFTAHRGELYGVPGAEEVRAQHAAGAHGPAVVPAYGHRPDFGRDGPVLERADRHH